MSAVACFQQDAGLASEAPGLVDLESQVCARGNAAMNSLTTKSDASSKT